MLLFHRSQTEIAAKLGVSRALVGHEVAKARRRWAEDNSHVIAEDKERELDRIAQLERKCIEAWDESKTEKAPSGDPRFAAAVLHCIELRVKLLGLFAPIEIEATLRKPISFVTVLVQPDPGAAVSPALPPARAGGK
jgi:hypothetical protein